MNKNIIENQFKIKKFLMTLYQEAITSGNNLKDNEYIRIYQNNKSNQIAFNEFSKVEFFNNIDDVVSYCTSKNCSFMNTYFTLATTDGSGGTLSNLQNRYFIGFDFDKKDYDSLTLADIVNKFNELKLYYHALVDSGNGYHAYICINETNDHKLVEEVTKTIAQKLGADLNACKTTQVLRMPLTYNIKNTKKLVRIIKLYDKETIKRYDIDKLAKRFCRDVKTTSDTNIKYILDTKVPNWVRIIKLYDKETIKRYDIDKLAKRFCRDVKTTSDTNIKYILDTKVPNCIADILKNGSKDGNKNKDLQKIIVSLRLRNKTLPQVFSIAKEWNYKSENSFSDNELEYQVNYIYENLRNVDFGCKNCNLTNECWSKIESDFIYTEDDTLLNVAHKHMKDLKYKNRKGSKFMNGNQLFIYNVLLNNKDRELNIDEIMELITYKRKNKIKNVAISEKTLRSTLKDYEW